MNLEETLRSHSAHLDCVVLDLDALAFLSSLAAPASLASLGQVCLFQAKWPEALDPGACPETPGTAMTSTTTSSFVFLEV